MCAHKDFDVIYYVEGVMLRRCKDCQKVEMHVDWDWSDLEEIKAALDWFQSNVGF